MLFTSQEYEIVGVANNGVEAVEKFKSFDIIPEIIIMDHRMPLKNGIEATKEILEINPHSKIIFASADVSIKEEALAIGATTFIEKPFDIQEVFEIIHNLFLIH